MSNKYEPLVVEEEVLTYWEKESIYKEAKKRVSNGKKFYFLDGPPYANGKVHVGTAWNKSLKDAFLRYKRKKGFNVFDRAGYDMHGLPVEHATEKELGLEDKEAIKRYGEKRFIEACRSLALRNMEIMNKDFKRLGVWMDFDNAYKTIDREFILGEWWLIKKAEEKGRLYEAYKTMHWCSHCGTALAKHELEYKTVTDDSIFIKFKIKDKENEYLLVWTTTPWTLPFNLGVMVNPEMEYVKVEVEHNGKKERWIIAKALMNTVIGGVLGKKYKLIEEFKGEEIEGLRYEPVIPTKPLLEAVKNSKKPENAFTVLLSSEYVTPTAGTGLVHCAPGCGPEDYEVGYKYGLPIFNNLNEEGYFPEEMEWLAGFKAKKDDKKIIKYLKEKDILLAIEPVEHEYAHCWRCKNPVIFRTTKQWFFKIEDLKEKLLEFNRKVKWVPDWSGSKQFASWLENLRDNTITRQRYWGAPVPIWRCKNCDHYEIIASDKEAEKLGGKLPEDLHKPEIDKVVLKCPKCGGEMHRIPDVLDVWIDAGTTSWNAIGYPKKEELFKEMYPPEFILEGKDQIRGWFNLLMIASIIALDKPGFRACYMHGFINDAKGRKMSKSLGNYILPKEVIEKYGADTLRYYFIGGTNPGLDLNYNDEDAKIRYRNLNILWNLKNYLIDIKNTYNVKPRMIEEIKDDELDIEDKYLLSKTERAIKLAGEALEEYRISDVPGIIEEAFLSMSRDYVKLVREKIVNSKEEREKKLGLMLYSYSRIINAFSIIAPFITEKIYQDLKKELKEFSKLEMFKEKSIHLYPWPEPVEKYINEELEQEIDSSMDIVTAINSAREKAGIKKRWPIAKVVVIPFKESIMKEIIARMGNTKSVEERKLEELRVEINNVEEIKKIAGVEIEKETREKEKKLEALTNGLRIVDKNGVETIIPPEQIQVSIKGIELPEWSISPSGIVIIEKKQDPELVKEAISREIIRRIQYERKKQGLVKTQKIKAWINTSGMAREAVDQYIEEIKEKCGINISLVMVLF